LMALFQQFFYENSTCFFTLLSGVGVDVLPTLIPVFGRLGVEESRLRHSKFNCRISLDTAQLKNTLKTVNPIKYTRNLK